MADICFGDFETRSLCDVTKAGAYKYARDPSTEGTVFGWIFDDEPAGFVWSPPWCWGNAPGTKADDDAKLERLFDHVFNGGYMVFWNANFDRHIWNEVMMPKYGWPYLPLEQVLCCQAQAEANNLPGRLEKACEALGTHFKKDPKGKRLIGLLSHGDRDSWNIEDETPDKMGHFRSYCLKDNLSMRDVWQYTRPLTVGEWDQYHTSERINDRGAAVDVPFATAAMEYANAEYYDINQQMAELTGWPKMTVTNHPLKARYLHEKLYPDQELADLVARPPAKDKPDRPRYSADRSTRDAVLEMIMQPEHAERFDDGDVDHIVAFLELIEAGNSAAVRKFTAIVNSEYFGRVYGQYSFNGGGQTGRFSSRGVQVHNLIRDPVDKNNPDRAIDAIDDVMANMHSHDLARKYGYALSRLLARLIRPTFIAEDGNVLVWGDWDQIEGRGLPWLSDTDGGRAKLELFANGIDVYSVTAADIMGCPIDDIDDFHRQAMGKVPELALGFGGSIGAFSAMGRNYGVTLPEEEVRRIVQRWRDANTWCRGFWSKLWDAAMNAHKYPGEWFSAGRVRYMFHPGMMRGTLICELPSGRWIVYPQFKREWIEYEDDEGITRHKFRTSFVKGFGSGYGRIELWYGVLAENITQGTAADILREALTKVDDVCVLHTHDEIVLEVREDCEAEFRELLSDVMTTLPDWAEGLPLSCSITAGPYYSK